MHHRHAYGWASYWRARSSTIDQLPRRHDLRLRGRLITDPDEKLDVLFRFTEKLIPGRWDDTRPSTEQELKGTAAVAVEIESASAKVRTGMPSDEPEDLDLPTWAGVIPVRQIMEDPIADEHTPADMAVPGYLWDLVDQNRA
ncbi:MAG: pyridoxamine 5'-phosphate oxidase family protein [Thermomicrobiales bacterium]